MSKYIIQHTDGGDYDYSDCGSIEAAWEQEKSAHWVAAAIEAGKTIEECRAEFVASLHEYTEEEVMRAARDGYTWPLALGLVEVEEV